MERGSNCAHRIGDAFFLPHEDGLSREETVYSLQAFLPPRQFCFHIAFIRGTR
jgi:hypothetical protein